MRGYLSRSIRHTLVIDGEALYSAQLNCDCEIEAFRRFLEPPAFLNA